GTNCAISGGSFTADAANLADDASCTGFTNLSSPVQNLNIGTFADNGGSTKTFAISQPSPAIDSSSVACSGFDQRGVARGLNMVGNINAPRAGDCDVGAFEVAPAGSIRTLQFATSASSVPAGTSGTIQVPITLDSTLYQADTVKAYIWVSGGTAVAGIDYAPYGVQTINIAPNKELVFTEVTLLNSAPTTDKTIILSFAMANGPGFSGATRLGTQLTHTITLFGNQTTGQTYSTGSASELVNAITSANTTDGTDTILLTSDITLTVKADTSSDYGDSGLPAITSAITIEGQGHSITRDANAPNFRILKVAASGLLTLNNVTISGGKTNNSGFHFGGGILSEGAVILNNSLISANSADYGGGLLVNYGTANLYDSTITNNTAATFGAGLTLLVGNLTVEDSVVSNNTSSGNGAGIYVDLGSVTIDRSTIRGNHAANTGGGLIFGAGNGSAIITNSIFVGNSANSGVGAALAGSIYLSNSTFSGNSATTHAGGVYLSGYVVPMVVNHVTFVNNTAPDGGGIYAFDQSSLITLSDSIIVQSTAGGNCSISPNSFTASGTNFADDASCPGFTNVASSTLNIGALADNGGNTQTYALNVPSPALDSSTGTCGDFDQRGVARGINTSGAIDAPQAGDCDVGAFEVGGTISTLTFADADSTASIHSATHQVQLKLDSNLAQGDSAQAYVWVSGGTAVAGVDYAPFGVQTVSIIPGSSSGLVKVTLLDSTARADKTIILSIATQNGPGFGGPIHLGTQLTHTITTSELEGTPEPTSEPTSEPTPEVTPEPTDLPNAAPVRNYFTTNMPTLTWNPVAGTDHYEIQVSIHSDFTGAISYNVGNQLSFLWPDPLADHFYYWHVRACKGAATSTCGSWSKFDTFVVKTS
ncbi:MAG: choice-of-anchor Q domain-containing protein, partial [Chloroflexota bacterium]